MFLVKSNPGPTRPSTTARRPRGRWATEVLAPHAYKPFAHQL